MVDPAFGRSVKRRSPVRFSPKRFAILAALTFGGMALAFGLLVGVDTLGAQVQRLMPGYLNQERFGDAWPLTVSEGRVECRPGRVIVFTAGDTTYAVNGTARDAAGLPPIDLVWRDDPHIPGAKVNIAPVLNAGLAMCR